MLNITPESPRMGVNPPEKRLSGPIETPGPAGPLVVAVAYDELCTFEYAIAAEVFGLARPEMGVGWYRFATAAIEPGPLRAHGGLRVEADGGPELLDLADLIVMPGWKGVDAPVPARLSEALVAAYARGARLASICSGAFVLAATGLLDGKRAGTHWRYAEALRAAHPRVEVDASVLYVEEDRILTSAGSAAGIDLMLHIVRSDFGAEAANSVARRLVMPAHRSGGQVQFIERPVPKHRESRLVPLLDQMRAEIRRRWTIENMARVVSLSKRSFLRRFAEATGTSPGEWMASVRVDEAKRLLEATAASIDEIARLSGFGNTATLRHHFSRATALSPREYRNRFNHRAHGDIDDES